ncbi:MAG: hypothetical protein LBR81_02800 [Prevotellaceae bacterium]|jgi:hypothetical protein|nr:hypothetical protein [Prevotellaceae bacterium]
MRTKNNINKTLEKYLFTNPIPIKNKKEYFELFDFIFPSKDIFIAFLKEENFDLQIHYAKKILLRLSYDSFFGPPTALLWNLLDMETQLSVNEKKHYNGRDHFVHIVHLYLSGIYMFFYHHTLNENILTEFKNKRKITEIKSNNVTKSTVKDFIVAWRYFVLYHDIAYPIEYLLKENTDSKDKKAYLSIYNDISTSISKDLSLKSLAKFIGVYKLIKSASEFSFEKLRINCHESKREELKSYSNYFLTERIYGYETLRDVYALLNKENIIAVLCEKKTMSPMLIFIPGNSNPIKTTHNNRRSNLLSEIEESKNAPYNKNYFNLKNYSWEYYINSSVKLEELIKNLFPNISLSEFDQTVNYIHEKTSSDYSTIFSDTNFKQYCFNIYTILYEFTGYQKQNWQQSYSGRLTEVINDIGKEIPKRMSDIFEGLLSEKLKNINFDQDMNSNSTLDAVIESYLIKVANNYKKLSKVIAKPLEEEIRIQFNLKCNLKTIRESIEEIFQNKGIKLNLNIDIANNTLSYDNLLAKENNALYMQVISKLNNKITKSDLVDLSTLLVKNKPKYSNYDHGIASGLIFLSVVDIYKQLLFSAKNDDDFNKLLSIGIGLDFENDKDYLNYKINDIFIETSFAILTHNLYPANYTPNSKYKTKLYSNPFTYFGILLDSIQPWDRKIQVNQKTGELPYQTLSRGFDISIKNNKIRISEFDHRIDIQKRCEEMKKQLDSYLENASSFIELNFGEF